MTLAASYRRVRTRRSPHLDICRRNSPPRTDTAWGPSPDWRRYLWIGGFARDRRSQSQRRGQSVALRGSTRRRDQVAAKRRLRKSVCGIQVAVLRWVGLARRSRRRCGTWHPLEKSRCWRTWSSSDGNPRFRDIRIRAPSARLGSLAVEGRLIAGARGDAPARSLAFSERLRARQYERKLFASSAIRLLRPSSAIRRRSSVLPYRKWHAT
jgi:hypothetical protein